MRNLTPPTISVRQGIAEDVPAMFEIRVSVHENTATLQQLHASGIDESSVTEMLATGSRAWIAEDARQIAGFSLATREGELMALFVRPEFEGRGHGSLLLNAAVQWLSSQSIQKATLFTGRDTRAFRFYLKRGWIETGDVAPNGDIGLELPLRGD